MIKQLIQLSTFVGMVFGALAWAHETLTPHHGGRIVETEGYRLELVTTESRVELYVTDHDDRPVAVDQAKGKVVLLAAGGKVEIPLAPAVGELLVGTGAMADGGRAAAVIVVEGLAKRLTARLPAGRQ